MPSAITYFFGGPVPGRFLLLRLLDKAFNILSYPHKLRFHTVDRPQYGHCLHQAALLARKLGHKRISAIEFGVAGGHGLVALEKHAEYVRQDTGVELVVYGFDTGIGMPQPVDYRDMPYLWQPGYFAMDLPKLKARLKAAKLVLGPVEETVRDFVARENPPPIGFISFDLDYYSSTVAAFGIFDAGHEYFLPRVACYFDDVVGDIDWAYNEFAGELLAIREFNAAHEDMKISLVRGLRFSHNRIPAVWHEQVFVAHMFKHPDYARPTNEMIQLPLDGAAVLQPVWEETGSSAAFQGRREGQRSDDLAPIDKTASRRPNARSE